MKIPFPFVRRYEPAAPSIHDLTSEVMVSAELCGLPMSHNAASLLIYDLLSMYPKEQIYAALARCRLGMKGTLGNEIKNAMPEQAATKTNGVGAVADISSTKTESFCRSESESPVINTASDEAWVLSGVKR